MLCRGWVTRCSAPPFNHPPGSTPSLPPSFPPSLLLSLPTSLCLSPPTLPPSSGLTDMAVREQRSHDRHRGPWDQMLSQQSTQSKVIESVEVEGASRDPRPGNVLRIHPPRARARACDLRRRSKALMQGFILRCSYSKKKMTLHPLRSDDDSLMEAAH